MDRITVTAQNRIDGGWTLEALLGGRVVNRNIVKEDEDLDAGKCRLVVRTIEQCAKALDVKVETWPYTKLSIDKKRLEDIEDFHVLTKQEQLQFRLLNAAVNWMETFTEVVKAAEAYENQVFEFR